MSSDQYRYFELGNDDFYRVHRDGSPVEFWVGGEWMLSVLPDLAGFLDDALGSGVSVREVLDMAEVPRVQ